MKNSMIVVGLVGILALAGCMGGQDQAPAQRDQRLAVEHAESSEATTATVQGAPQPALTYADLLVDVEGRQFRFGDAPDWQGLRYQAVGKDDAADPVESGDKIVIPAAGLVTVRFIVAGKEVAQYEADVPDNRAPLAPSLSEPAQAAAGVTRNPTFKWAAVSDPSGVEYRITYSIDPLMQLAPVTRQVDALGTTSYAVPSGQELLSGMKYYWRAQAIDGAGNTSPWSANGEFTTA